MLRKLKYLLSPQRVDHPSSLIFLMKNTCNSRCIMCGLNYANNTKISEITLHDYETMLEHLRMDKVKEITFSGGGDPLLCKDLLEIIEYTRCNHPSVELFLYTNGIVLTPKFSKSIVENRFNKIVISINASTPQTHQRIMQVKAFDRVVNNVKNLVALKDKARARTIVEFSFVASKLNIDDLPGLIELATRLSVDSVSMLYCRFYSKKFNLNSNTSSDVLERKYSLFFHQEYSDQIVEKCIVLAREKKVNFAHEPLFRSRVAGKIKCTWPWTTILVGPRGEIYPCGGGEVIFNKSVAEGKLYFGNLLKQDITEFFHNEDFTKVRESSDYKNKCKSIPQCYNCNHAWKWEGINSEKSHFIDVDI